jgi:hydroxymethylpyrimidine/phosphomethylpyrimidine kinase
MPSPRLDGAGGAALPWPVILTIAGSDSGGGAGIQADLKTMTVLGAFGVSAIVALTAQNGAGVRGIHEAPADFIRLQLDAVREGFPVKAAKTGMLASVPIIEVVAQDLGERDFPLVVDPVCVSQSGHRLLRKDAEGAMRTLMLPRADVLTPNKPEAELLSGVAIEDQASLFRALERLHALGARAVLLKGGHFAEQHARESMTDWLSLPGSNPLPLSHPRVRTSNNHGTGCTLSAALATFLGFGLPLPEAVVKAQAYLTRALESGFSPGIGAGPPNFLGGARL